MGPVSLSHVLSGWGIHLIKSSWSPCGTQELEVSKGEVESQGGKMVQSCLLAHLK